VKLDHGKKFNFQTSRFAKYRMAYYMNKDFLQQTQTYPLKNISPGQTAFCRAGKFSIKGEYSARNIDRGLVRREHLPSPAR
jgi:hypothetical protein